MQDYEYVVIDPVLGEVSCGNSGDALDYADKVHGEAFRVLWQDGVEVGRDPASVWA